MVALADLWLPILVSGVVVFVVSSVIHMLIPIHRGDYAKLPGEDAVRAGYLRKIDAKVMLQAAMDADVGG